MGLKKDKDKETTMLQTISEEIVNAITHGIGSLLSIVGLIFLLYFSVKKASTTHVVSCSLYGGSLVLLYTISTLYHSITHETAKKVFRRLDHISIYLLIAGSYIPIALVVLKGTIGWTLFGIECGLCLIGIVFKAVFGPRFGVVSGLFYLLMGWIAIIAVKPIYTSLPKNALMWLLLGGAFYTLGIFFFAIDKKFSFFHAIWHLFVLAGSICHYIMIFVYIIPFSI